jgi:hypothetical protein
MTESDRSADPDLGIHSEGRALRPVDGDPGRVPDPIG